MLNVKISNEKIYSHKFIHGKTPVMASFLVKLQAGALTVLLKDEFIKDAFCEICSNILGLSLALSAMDQCS